MTRGDERETPGAVCENLPLEEAVDLFFPTSEGGQMKRTNRWPKPDTHEAARRYCGHCPVLAGCLAGALEQDCWTFRGGMSPEERAAFGGYRDRDTRRRPVYLHQAEVAARLVEAGVDLTAVGRVLGEWQATVTADPKLAKETGSVVDENAETTSPEQLAALADRLMRERRSAS